MMILLVAGLLGVAAVVLTLPWGRRDPARFSAADIGYVRGGSVGAVLAVLGVLYVEGLVEVRPRGGYQRTRLPLPDEAEPLARAVHSALDSPARLRKILTQWRVRRAVEASATKVYAARLRTGELRRFAGTGMAFAAVALAVVALVADGIDLRGIVVAVVALAGAVLLWRGRFVTVAGRRLVAEVRRSVPAPLPAPPERRVLREPVHADTRLDTNQMAFAYAGFHLAVAAGLGSSAVPGDKEWPDDLKLDTGYGADYGSGDFGGGDSGFGDGGSSGGGGDY